MGHLAPQPINDGDGQSGHKQAGDCIAVRADPALMSWRAEDSRWRMSDISLLLAINAELAPV
jgi:hypothetical protein